MDLPFRTRSNGNSTSFKKRSKVDYGGIFSFPPHGAMTVTGTFRFEECTKGDCGILPRVMVHHFRDQGMLRQRQWWESSCGVMSEYSHLQIRRVIRRRRYSSPLPVSKKVPQTDLILPITDV